jgi:hypothetical protein
MGMIDKAKEIKRKRKSEEQERIDREEQERARKIKYIEDLKPIVIEMGKRMEKDGFKVETSSPSYDTARIKIECCKEGYHPIIIESGEVTDYYINCNFNEKPYTTRGVTITAPTNKDKYYSDLYKGSIAISTNNVDKECEKIETKLAKYLANYGKLVGVRI